MPEPDLIQQAIQAVKAGERELAQNLLSQILAADPNNDQAWLWLAACVNDIEKRRYCLERALAIRPDNAPARQALEQLAPGAASSPEAAGPALSLSEPSAPKPRATPTAKKRSGFSPLQTCLVVLLAIIMLAAIAALALIVLRDRGLALPAALLQPAQAPGLDAPLTFIQLPATWTPAPTRSSVQPGPTMAMTPTSGAITTPLPSLTPISAERMIVIGRSVKNRPIEVYRFGSGQKERMIVAGIHGGDEGNTIALAEQLIAHLRRHPRTVPAGYTLYILRSLNPDGEVFGNVPEGRLNGNGVDLNRNFDVGWKSEWRSDGCSSLPGTGGSGPGSEPETQALKDFLHSRRVEVLISYHSAYLGVFPSGDPAHPESARLAQAIHDISNYPYPPVRNGCEYTGTLVDWAASIGVIAAVDLELNSGVDTEFDTNLRVLSLLFSFEPQGLPPPPPSPSGNPPTDISQSPTATQTISVTYTVTPTVTLTVTPNLNTTPTP